MMMQRKLIVYIACSLDGIIAGPGDDLSFLKQVEQPGEDYGYENFINDIDTVIMGRKTYDWLVKKVGGYPDKSRNVYILSNTAKAAVDNVQFYTGDPAKLLDDLRLQEGKHIFLDGGAIAIDYFRGKSLVNEWIISIVPVLLGSGVQLFKIGHQPEALKLISARQFETGLVQLHYTHR